MQKVCIKMLFILEIFPMRLLIAFLALAGVTVGAFGYFAFNGKTQNSKRTNFFGINANSATSQIKTNTCCKEKCCDEEELENQNPT